MTEGIMIHAGTMRINNYLSNLSLLHSNVSSAASQVQFMSPRQIPMDMLSSAYHSPVTSKQPPAYGNPRNQEKGQGVAVIETMNPRAPEIFSSTLEISEFRPCSYTSKRTRTLGLISQGTSLKSCT
ncbi:hypothetical protein CFIMG_007953RA00001 [Ceratocystis fimbriata CBS 114723]|uniref:Uncharacterized protein n=1 Tax=Ceratocystis fimbriata CBS 114723 TaxID=1035309 RepID=A0A2C5WZX8_9PEZI|nr:hypothetical protein CFIMG_007953RA00001 [Ceratocystis fimbriata CBS 114723]